MHLCNIIYSIGHISEARIAYHSFNKLFCIHYSGPVYTTLRTEVQGFFKGVALQQHAGIELQSIHTIFVMRYDLFIHGEPCKTTLLWELSTKNPQQIYSGGAHAYDNTT